MLRSSTPFAATMGTLLAIMAVAVGPLWGQPAGETPGTGIGSLFGNSLQRPNKVCLGLRLVFCTGRRQAGRLAITASMLPPWHIYSITQPPGGPPATKITLTPSSAYRLAGALTANPPPETKPEPPFNNLMVESHRGSVTWRAPLNCARVVRRR